MTVGPDPGTAARHADGLLGSGRAGDAVEVLAAAVGAHPDRPELWGRLAAALLAVGQLPEAWDAAARTVELAPAEPEAHRTIGSVALAMGALPQAETAFRQVLTLDPADAGARAALGTVAARRAGTAPTAGSGRRRAPDTAPAEPPLTRLERRHAAGSVDFPQETGAERRHAAGSVEVTGAERRAVEAGGPRELGATARLGFIRWLRGQWLLALAAYLGLAHPESAPFTAAGVTAIAVVLGAFAWLRWQALPASVRTAVLRLPHRDPRAWLPVGLALLGTAALAVLVPASMLGALMVARLATVGSVAATGAAVLLTGRDRQPVLLAGRDRQAAAAEAEIGLPGRIGDSRPGSATPSGTRPAAPAAE